MNRYTHPLSFVTRSLCALLLSISLLPAAHASEPSAEPMLRIETGMHTAVIKRIGIDAAGRYLATVSTDKTARIWELASGRLINTLRPPLGTESEGQLYAVALSPDGKTVAVAGWTGYEWDRSFSVYLYDRESGRLLRRLAGLPNTILDMSWSADGRWLAMGFFGSGNGMRVYRTHDWKEAGRDAEYGDSCLDLDFGRDGRLAAASTDGMIRIYQMTPQGVQRLFKQEAPGGRRPFAVSYAPDGRRIAVGFEDVRQVSVLDAATLALLYVPDTSGVNNDNVGKLAWSADGSVLYGGGSYGANGRALIRGWSEGGRGKPQDYPASVNVLLDLQPLPRGGVVFAAYDPSWGVLDGNGNLVRFVWGEIADFRDMNLKLSRDGRMIAFDYAWPNKFPSHFSLEEGLLPGNTAAAGLADPITTAAGINVTQWRHQSAPRFNEQLLAFDRYEISRSLAIAPDARSFVLGTSWHLRYYERSGVQRWLAKLPGEAWAVNLSADGRWAVAALSDGTIRWYDVRNGAERLAFFPHADRKRWVMWTPSGYYAASPGAEDLIGWHLNRGKDAAADFFPVSRFRNQFYRPDVIAKALQADSETEALRLANEEAGRKVAAPVAIQNALPPVVELVSAAELSSNQPTVTVRYRVRTLADAPVTAVRARVNGQALSGERALKRAGNDDVREIDIPIPPQDSEIQLFAENKNGISTPATLRVKWTGKAPEPGFTVKPKLYVLAVGVSQYDNPEYRLNFAAKDARDFAATMQQQKGRLYREVEVKLLTDSEATRDNVVDALDWLKEQVTQRDIGMLFIAGHGINDAEGKYYYLPVNADVDRLKRTGVVFTDIKDTLANLAGKALFFIDTCHSGNVLGGRRAVNASNTDAVVNELASAENGVVVFSSSTGKQFSLENEKWGNGAFTKALIEGISGKADFQNNGRITHKQLDFYLSERVKELTGGKQTPVSQAPGGVPDFPVALTR